MSLQDIILIQGYHMRRKPKPHIILIQGYHMRRKPKPPWRHGLHAGLWCHA
jgi:hypothetical protein